MRTVSQIRSFLGQFPGGDGVSQTYTTGGKGVASTDTPTIIHARVSVLWIPLATDGVCNTYPVPPGCKRDLHPWRRLAVAAATAIDAVAGMRTHSRPQVRRAEREQGRGCVPAALLIPLRGRFPCLPNHPGDVRPPSRRRAGPSNAPCSSAWRLMPASPRRRRCEDATARRLRPSASRPDSRGWLSSTGESLPTPVSCLVRRSAGALRREQGFRSAARWSRPVLRVVHVVSRTARRGRVEGEGPGHQNPECQNPYGSGVPGICPVPWFGG